MNPVYFRPFTEVIPFITSRDGPFWKWYCCVLNHANITRCKSFLWNADGTIESSSLVGDFNPSEKYESNWKSSPNRSENTTYIKPPPRSALHRTSYKCIEFQKTHASHIQTGHLKERNLGPIQNIPLYQAETTQWCAIWFQIGKELFNSNQSIFRWNWLNNFLARCLSNLFEGMLRDRELRDASCHILYGNIA